MLGGLSAYLLGELSAYPHTTKYILRPLSNGCESKVRFGQAETSKRDITEEQAFFTKDKALSCRAK